MYIIASKLRSNFDQVGNLKRKITNFFLHLCSRLRDKKNKKIEGKLLRTVIERVPQFNIYTCYWGWPHNIVGYLSHKRICKFCGLINLLQDIICKNPKRFL